MPSATCPIGPTNGYVILFHTELNIDRSFHAMTIFIQDSICNSLKKNILESFECMHGAQCL